MSSRSNKRKIVQRTMGTNDDRFVTDSVTFDNTQAETVGVSFPGNVDDATAVHLEISERPHRYNYPCMADKDGVAKSKPEGKNGYADNGIIFEFDMDDADGTTVTDRVNGLVLTEAGDPAFQETPAIAGLGNGLTFDGTGDQLNYAFTSATVAAPYPLVETGDFSVEVVFKATNTTTDTADTVVCCRDGAAGVGWAMHFDSNEYLDFVIEDATAEVTCTGATDAATDSIVHAIASMDRDGNGNIYINGAVDDTTDISGSSGTLLNPSADTLFAIGGDAASTANSNLYGSVYFVRVYNYALSAAEALENYNVMMNQGYPGWVPLLDPVDGDDLAICKSGSQPGYYDLTEFMTLKRCSMRTSCAVEQTTSPVAQVYTWIFE